MSYTVKYYNHYELTSNLDRGTCDCCKKDMLIQYLPAEHNAGEIIEVRLCKKVFIKVN